MLKNKAKDFIENAKNFKKRVHQTIMSDSLKKMDDATFDLLKDTMKFIDEALEVCTQQNELLVVIDHEIKTALEEIEG